MIIFALFGGLVLGGAAFALLKRLGLSSNSHNHQLHIVGLFFGQVDDAEGHDSRKSGRRIVERFERLRATSFASSAPGSVAFEDR